jgi:hypothetical protein
MSHLTSTTAHLVITTVNRDGARTEHRTENWFSTYVEARRIVARYVADNCLARIGYGDTEHLFRDGEHVGRYTITRS